jgi:HlyD family secretion protein
MTRKRTMMWMLASVGLVATAGAGVATRASTASKPTITTVEVTRGSLVQSVSATGSLEAVTTVNVGTQVSGTVQSLYADFNDLVRKGQVLARLDPSLFAARLEQARANLLSARANVDRARASVDDTRQKYERAKELAAEKLLPTSDLETAKANFDGAVAQQKANEAAESQAQANLNQAQVDLSHTIIATPIDGVVISRNVDVGQTVAASFQAPVLFLIANDLTRMRVNASVDEADVGRVREGQEVAFHVDAFPEREFVGKVEQVRLNPTTVQNVVSYNTIVAVDNQSLLLRPGMTATVSIIVRKAEAALRLPAAAVRFRPEGFQRPAGAGRGSGAQAGGASGQRAERTDGGRPQGAPAGGGGGGAIPGAAMAGERGGPAGGAATGAAPGGDRPRGERGPGTAGPASGGSGGGRGWGRPTTVFVLDEKGQPKPLEIRVGISDGQFVEVREGLEEGAVVITGTEIPGARGAGGPRPGASPSTNPFSPQFQRRQR